MKIESKNLHDERHAELEVTVGYGCDQTGTEFPSITYHITPQGVSIDRCTTDGVHRGGLDLSLTMLDALCRVSGTSRDHVIAARAKLFPDYEAKLHDAHLLVDDVDALRNQAIASINGATTSLSSVAPALLRVLEAYALTQAAPKDAASGCGSSCGPKSIHDKSQDCPMRKMKTPDGSAAFTGEQLAERMMQICGCKGQHDCDCTSVQNQARVEMWTEFNVRGKSK